VKNVVLCHVTPFCSCNNRCFEGTYHLHHQGEKNQRARKNVSSSRFADSSHPDDGGDTFLRSIGSYKSKTVSHDIRRLSS
jgi:hypothetical protein